MLSSREAAEDIPEMDLEAISSRVYLGLGSSLGDRMAHLRTALHCLQCPQKQTRVLQVSSIYETPHMGLKAGDDVRYPPHLNCVALIETNLAPLPLLRRILEIEAGGARQRVERWGPRTIDIDLLLYLEADHQKSHHLKPHHWEADNSSYQEVEKPYNNCKADKGKDDTRESGFRNISLETCELTLPHPAMASRIFVVVPLLEIAPNITLADGQPVRDLLETHSLRAQPIKRVHSDELLI